MKKFLALVLALVMTMSLVTISAGAEDFTDAADINYEEAVDVISALGVVGGYADGSFNPDGGLTRQAAAKIICNMILGPTTAAELDADTNPYPDVDKDSQFAGYIAYCQKEGIISGYADGTFKPAAPLTGYAFMKMLLGALGYDVEVEGYTGANWSINVAKRAINIGLDDGLVDNFNGSDYVTREEAMLYAFNAMQADMVEYDTTITIGDITVAGSKAAEVEYTGRYDGNIYDDEVLQFAEKYFVKLTANYADADAFDRPATTWKNGVSKIGTYVNTADLEYTAAVELGDIYKALGLSKATATNEYYVDGKELTDITLTKGDDTKIGANGVLTQVWYDEDASNLVITHINTYVGEVSSVTKATAKADRYINLSKAVGHAPSSLNSKFETELFVKGDLVMYTAAETADETTYAVQTVEALELTDTGVLTEWNGTTANLTNADKAGAESDFTVGGELYNYSAQAYIVDENGFGSETDISAFDVDESELNVYCDNYGYAIYVSGVEGETNYAALIGCGLTNQYGSETRGVTLLLPDGTLKTVTAKLAGNGTWDTTNTAGNLVNEDKGDIVTYTVDEDGVYVLTVADKYDTTYTDADDIQFVNGKSLFKLVDATYPATLYTTSETVFMVATDDGTSKAYNVYVGYENMPSIDATLASAGIAYVCNDKYSTQIDVVYLAVDALAGISDVDTYVVKHADAKIVTNSKGDYYVLPAIVDGEEATVMISADFKADSAVFTDKDGNATDEFEKAVGLYALNNVTKNSKDIIVDFEVVNATVFDAHNGVTGTVAANKVVLGLNGNKDTATFWAYNDKTNVYVVDKDYKTITVSAVSDIDTDANDKVYASHDNGAPEKKLQDVVIVKQDDVAPSADASIKSIKVKGLDVVNGEVTLTSTAAASAAKGLVVETTDSNATYTVEWKNDADWAAYSMNFAGNVAGDANWNDGDLQFRITVTAEDGTSTSVTVVKVAYETVYSLVFNFPANVRVTMNGQRVVSGETWTCQKDYVATFAVVAADGYTATVNDGTSDLVGFNGEYDVKISANTEITITANASV